MVNKIHFLERKKENKLSLIDWGSQQDSKLYVAKSLRKKISNKVRKGKKMCCEYQIISWKDKATLHGFKPFRSLSLTKENPQSHKQTIHMYMQSVQRLPSVCFFRIFFVMIYYSEIENDTNEFLIIIWRGKQIYDFAFIIINSSRRKTARSVSE